MQSHARVTLSVPVQQSARVGQICGLFDVPTMQRSERSWEVDLPLSERAWHIGMIVGSSGSGKSTLLKALFGDAPAMAWRDVQPVVPYPLRGRQGLWFVTAGELNLCADTNGGAEAWRTS